MQRWILSLVALLLLVVALGGTWGWRRIQALQGEIGGLSEVVTELGDELAEAEERAAAADERAARAEARAGSAEAQVEAAEGRATEAGTEAAEAKARVAEATSARRRAEEARAEAERRRKEALSAAEGAEREAREARSRLQEIERQRERDLDRLQRAMERITETRRTALGLVMSLGGDRIEFDFDKADLRQENRELLSRVAGVLLTAEDFEIEVFGHTDDIGSEAYNQELSELRAGAVRDYLVEAGLDPRIITTRGFGKSQPLVEGTDDASRQRNRRVEIAIVHVSVEYPPIPVEG